MCHCLAGELNLIDQSSPQQLVNQLHERRYWNRAECLRIVLSCLAPSEFEWSTLVTGNNVQHNILHWVAEIGVPIGGVEVLIAWLWQCSLQDHHNYLDQYLNEVDWNGNNPERYALSIHRADIAEYYHNERLNAEYWHLPI